jgi:hypothetical protein
MTAESVGFRMAINYETFPASSESTIRGASVVSQKFIDYFAGRFHQFPPLKKGARGTSSHRQTKIPLNPPLLNFVEGGILLSSRFEFVNGFIKHDTSPRIV